MHTGKQKQMNVSYQASLVNRHIRRFTGLYFPHRWQQNFQTFGAVNNTTLNSLVKIKKIWLYQRVPDIRHGIIDLIFCRITPQIRVPRNRNHFSTERNRKKEKVEHILLRKSCYIKPLSLVKIPPPLTWIFFSNKLNWISSTLQG